VGGGSSPKGRVEGGALGTADFTAYIIAIEDLIERRGEVDRASVT